MLNKMEQDHARLHNCFEHMSDRGLGDEEMQMDPFWLLTLDDKTFQWKH